MSQTHALEFQVLSRAVHSLLQQLVKQIQVVLSARQRKEEALQHLAALRSQESPFDDGHLHAKTNNASSYCIILEVVDKEEN